MKAKYTGQGNHSGIYEIVNAVNGKRYIGSATRFAGRWSVHRAYLRSGKSSCSLLQKAWNKYGEDKFIFRILETINDKSLLIEREQYYIDTLKPEYNATQVAGHNSMLGRKHSPETRAKMSASMQGNKNGIGHIVTDEAKAALSAQMLGNTHGSLRKNTKHTPETRALMSEKKKGKGWTPAQRAAREAADLRRKQSLPS
jgi:group I intron endonuclease